MKMYTHFLRIAICVSMLCICSSAPLVAQTLDRQVISSAGENFQTTNGSLIFTIGELAVETFKHEGQLSQGFHQEWAVITSMPSAYAEQLAVKVYPNPTMGILNIESEAALQLHLYDLTGTLKIIASQPIGSGQIKMFDFPAGLYILEISDNDGKKKVLKIEKIE